MSKRAVHILNPIGVQYAAMLVDRNARMLCGKPLYYKNGSTYGADRKPLKSRESTISIDNYATPLRRPRSSPDPKRCTECWRLAAMTPGQRALHLELKKQKTTNAFDKLKSKKAEADRIKNETRSAKIEAARGDALVCLDAFVNSDGKHYPERCKTWLRTEHPKQAGDSATQIRCNLVRGHDGDCKERTWEGLALDMREVLDIAIDAHKFANRSGGHRLVVMRDGARACRYCSGELSDGDTCDGCSRPLPKPARATPRDVCCRFCSVVLGRQQSPFEDYSHAAFHPDGSRLQTIPQYANAPDDFIDVWKHTVVCALSYLAGVVRTEQTDEPLKVMPASSFVLEMDQ